MLSSAHIDLLRSVAFFGIISAIVLRICYVAGFFHLRSPRKIPISFSLLLINFAIYLGGTLFAAPFAAFLMDSFYLKEFKMPPPDEAFGFLQTAFLILIFLLFYLSTRTVEKSLFQSIWKKDPLSPPSLIKDLAMGALTCLISFPLVTAIAQISDFFLYLWTPFQGYEQVAITYLKMTIHSPALLMTALITILIAAPCIEEFLFRGCLQNFLKNFLSAKQAIVLSSLCFALFHFSASQGLGNISLCFSLFILALFLGFIYERQNSLFASVGLHFTFNLINTLRVLFYP